MKKMLLVFLILLLLSMTALAEEITFEGWVYNTKYIVLDDQTYKILMSNNGQTMLLISDNTIHLNSGSCEETDYRKFCYNISAFDETAKDYKAYLYVYNRVPSIKLTRKVSDNILAVGEKATFQATITNEGDTDVNNIIFNEDLPPEVEIEKVKNAQISGNIVHWEGNLKASESYVIEYIVKSNAKLDSYLKASVKYFDGFSEKTVYSDPVRFYSSSVFSIDIYSSKEDYELGEEIEVNVNIKNSGDLKLTIDKLRIEMPESFIILDKDSKLDNDNIYKGTLDSGETKSFKFKLKGMKTGAVFISAAANYEYDSKSYTLDDALKGVVLHNSGIELTTTLSNAEVIDAGQKLLILLKVKNKNSFSSIKRINLDVVTDIAYFPSTTYNSLGVNQTAVLLSTEIVAPVVSTETVYNIIFNV
jgi:uncharacterized repeat protein (TIGR01451 family)